jgi:hypothetical protein
LLTGGVADRMVNLKNFANTTNTSDINQFRVEVTTSLALLVGLIHFLMGIFGLGINLKHIPIINIILIHIVYLRHFILFF